MMTYEQMEDIVNMTEATTALKALEKLRHRWDLVVGPLTISLGSFVATHLSKGPRSSAILCITILGAVNISAKSRAMSKKSNTLHRTSD
jgi:hypothetical protein